MHLLQLTILLCSTIAYWKASIGPALVQHTLHTGLYHFVFCREQRISGVQADLLGPDDKAAYLEQASSLRLALGKLSLERKSLRAPGQDEDDADMHQVEMLLQAYFIHMDNTFNRLDTMNEYISDTEVWKT